ncbi:MAG: nitroreductase family protein [Eubacteriales bacterium]|nr:nitroreductase family protein [Eubacteriales bacterium]
MKNEVLNTISKRRSHRKYKKTKLNEEQLQLIMNAAMESPSALNRQPWHFSVVQNEELLDRVHNAAKKVALTKEDRSPRYNDDNFQIFYYAPAVIFISTDDSRYAEIDAGIAAQTIALAAESLGLGSVILGLPREAFEGEEKEDLEKILSFPEGYQFTIAVAIGVPDDTKAPHPQKEGKITYM